MKLLSPMTNKLTFETVDQTLRDLTDRNEPFGGIVFIMSRDFCQVLLIIPRGSHVDIVFASIKNSYLWEFVEVFRLSKNMRADDAYYCLPRSWESHFCKLAYLSWQQRVGNHR